MVKVSINDSRIGGKGVFAINKIKKEEKVFRFSDNLIFLNHKPGCDCKVCKRCISLKKNLWLHPEKNSFGWNLNHSCNPNCYVKERDIFALKDIKKQEEITIDYSATAVDEKWKMREICGCKEKNCRKIIRSIQSLPENFFTKYKGFMPRYAQSKWADKRK